MQPCDKIVDDCIKLYKGGASSLNTILDNIGKSNSTVLTRVNIPEPAATDTGFRARGEFQVEGMPLIRLVADGKAKKGAITNIVYAFLDKVIQMSPKYQHLYTGPQSWHKIAKQIDAVRTREVIPDPQPLNLKPVFDSIDELGFKVSPLKSHLEEPVTVLGVDMSEEDEEMPPLIDGGTDAKNPFRVEIANVMPAEDDLRPIVLLDCGVGETVTEAHERAYHIIGFADNSGQLRPKRYLMPQIQVRDGADALAAYVAGMFAIAKVFDNHKIFVVSRDHMFSNITTLLTLSGFTVELRAQLPVPPAEKKTIAAVSGRTRALIIG